jgi:hypothetical protein
VTFVVDDLELPWFQKYRYDFIFGRDLTLCFKDPYFVLQSAFEALEPGGYIEFQNIILPFRFDDDTLRGTAFQKWMDLISEGAKRLHRNWNTASGLKAMMERVGLVDIHETRYQWPIGTWPKDEHLKELGVWVYTSLVVQKGIHAISAKVLTKGMEMNSNEVDDLIEQVTLEITCRKFHATIPV